ncbi:recombinase family protein [Vibrio kagoshimensis]|uniref:recombinase family protein n=1 Tax=Vibrio kagoshimensis TaxID=2910244 RepID=UPI003D2576AC
MPRKIGFVSGMDQIHSIQSKLVSIELDKVFIEDEKAKPGSNSEALSECIRFLERGDSVYVESFSSLATSLSDLHHRSKQILSQGASIVFVAENIVLSEDEVNSSVVSLRLFDSFVKFENSLLSECQKASTDSRIGRPSVPSKVRKAVIAQNEQRIPKAQIAKQHGISRQTVYRILNEKSSRR